MWQRGWTRRGGLDTHSLRKLNASPHDCLFVGDNPQWDMLGPQTIGVKAILIDRAGTVRNVENERIRTLGELVTKLQ